MGCGLPSGGIRCPATSLFVTVVAIDGQCLHQLNDDVLILLIHLSVAILL